MDAGFWHDKWERGEIGFHNKQANPLLTDNWSALGIVSGTVFMPLCGKSLDIAWLLGQGFEVVGAELSELAVGQLFEELGVEAAISDVTPSGSASKLSLWQADGLKVFVGDIFDLSPSILGMVDAVYDRAAIVALPEAVRASYSQHITHITDCAPQLVVCFEYDQSQISGPPFSVDAAEIGRHYDGFYQRDLLMQIDVEGGLKGKVAASESVWHLYPR